MSARHTVHLRTRDGHTLSFDCAEGDDLLAGAEKAGITLPSSCRAGACGACGGRCRDGRFTLGEHSEHALNAEAANAGYILACRTHPLSELTVDVAADLAHITSGPVPRQSCAVMAVEDLGGGVMRLVLKGQDADIPFEPGQFMEVFLPGTDTARAYSMANAPNAEGTLEFLVRLQPGGLFSTWLLERARAGDVLETRGPQGSLVLHSGRPHPRRFIAGGTGLAPMLSMLRHMADLGEINDAHLYFGVTGERDLFGQAQLDALRARLPQLRIDLCVWKPGPDWTGFSGTPLQALERDLGIELLKGLTPEIYICGPPGLVDAAEALAQSEGVPLEAIYSEKFLPS